MGRSQDNTQNLNCGQLQTEDFFKMEDFFFKKIKASFFFHSQNAKRNWEGEGVKKKKGGT